MSNNLALASGSPRRRELLASLGLETVRVASDVDESRQQGEPITDYVKRLAITKAQCGRADSRSDGLMVLAGDTAVATGEILHDKPVDAASAFAALRALSGRWHEVHSGVALLRIDGRIDARVVSTRVKLRELGDAEIEAYWATGEPADKAGAYAVQGLGGMFVERLEGSYSAVVGLPVFETAQLLIDAGLPILTPTRSAA